MKTMNLVLNLATRYQVLNPLRIIDLRKVIKEDRRDLTRVIPMFQGVRVDEDLLQGAFKDNCSSLVDMDLLLANSLGMVHHHRVDLLKPLGGSNHLHRINFHSIK